MDNIQFDINDGLKHYMSDPATIATPEADSALVDCENDPEALSRSSAESSFLYNSTRVASAGSLDVYWEIAFLLP